MFFTRGLRPQLNFDPRTASKYTPRCNRLSTPKGNGQTLKILAHQALFNSQALIIYILVFCVLRHVFKQTDLTQSVLDATNWPISAFEKRLRETERSYNDVVSVKRSDHAFYIIKRGLKTVISLVLSQFKKACAMIFTNFTIFRL